MTKILKFTLLFAASLAISACDSGKSSAGASDTKPAATADKTAAAKDWTATVVETPEGGFRMGNPDAKVKLVEFASFTCSHCKDFHADAVAHLKPEYVAKGLVSYEYRPFMLNIFDFAAATVAMCQGPERFFDWSNELYTNHDAWIEPFTKLDQNDVKPLANLPLGKQVIGFAKLGKLNGFAAQRGLPGAKFDECVGNETAIEALAKRQQTAIDTYQIAGTPTFLLNGKKVEGVTAWKDLQPKIDAAL